MTEFSYGLFIFVVSSLYLSYAYYKDYKNEKSD